MYRAKTTVLLTCLLLLWSLVFFILNSLKTKEKKLGWFGSHAEAALYIDFIFLHGRAWQMFIVDVVKGNRGVVRSMTSPKHSQSHANIPFVTSFTEQPMAKTTEVGDVTDAGSQWRYFAELMGGPWYSLCWFQVRVLVELSVCRLLVWCGRRAHASLVFTTCVYIGWY